MLFNSIQFLIFFPIVTIFYFVMPHKVRYIWLLFSSYFFYMCWSPKYALLIAFSTVITYCSGLLIDRENLQKDEKKQIRRKKFWVALSFILNLSILFFFKYFNFVINNINIVISQFNISPVQPSFNILLPVGISFYTFQALSYTMDVYRNDIYAEKNILKYALFVSFFPQLVAGPIERSKNLLKQINEKHVFSYERMKDGLLLMLWGYFEKVVVADRVAILVDQVFNNYSNYTGFSILIASILFAIQIYCDFCGYSDIAIGAAQVMGFHLMDNFHRPYFSKSIAEFWRRWHISLSTWFRDYLYIPLGGNRCSKIKKYRNIMIVFLTSGLWHGSSWNYVVWGGLHGIYQIIGDILKPWREKFKQFFHIKTHCFSYRLFQVIITFSLVDFAWIFFRASSFRTALRLIKQMFSSLNPTIFFDGSLFTMGLDQKDFIVMVLSIILLLLVDLARRKVHLRKFLKEQNLLFRWLVYYLFIFVILIFGIYGPSYDVSQFIYFQF